MKKFPGSSCLSFLCFPLAKPNWKGVGKGAMEVQLEEVSPISYRVECDNDEKWIREQRD